MGSPRPLNYSQTNRSHPLNTTLCVHAHTHRHTHLLVFLSRERQVN